MGKIIKLDKSIIPACDMPLNLFEKLVKETADVEKIGGYKIGFFLALQYGLPKLVDIAKKYAPNKAVIYDHQKAGTDIPDLSKKFVDACKFANVDAVILFPQSGPITQYEWIKAAQDADLEVIIGGLMTHPRYLQEDFSNSKDKNYTEIFKELGFEEDLTGYLTRPAPEQIYSLSAKMGITNFVVPGNKPDEIKYFKELIISHGIENPVFFAPGFIAQGGELSEGAKAAGNYFHGIVGRGIYKAKNIKEAAIELTKNL